MANLIAFSNAFLSYLLLFLVIVVLVIIACVIGIRLRKRKNAKDAALSREIEKAAAKTEEP